MLPLIAVLRRLVVGMALLLMLVLLPACSASGQPPRQILMQAYESRLSRYDVFVGDRASLCSRV